MKRLPFPLVLIVFLVACSQPATPAKADGNASPAPASATTASAPSAGEYLLTMANIDAFFAAQPRLAAAVEADPSLDPAMDVSNEDVAAYAARLERSPALREAIASAGIPVHDYARTSEELMGALFAVGAMDAGLLEELPEGVSVRNVEFVRAHKAEIEAKAAAARG